MMNADKLLFLQREFIPLLQRLDPKTPPAWGRMNVHQMIEHFTDAVHLATGKLEYPDVGDAHSQRKAHAFMMSDKPMRENTRNPFLPEEPPVTRRATVQAAIADLHLALIEFFHAYEQDATKRTPNPFFGTLDYAEQVQLLHKHALHHLKQFGVVPLERS
jgi:hypothetical protein